MSSLDDDIVIRNRSEPREQEATNQAEEENDDSRPKITKSTSELPNGNIRQSSSNKFGFTKLLKKIYDHLEHIKYKLQIETYRKSTNNEWLLVALLIDKILFLAYCLIVIISTMTIFKY